MSEQQVLKAYQVGDCDIVAAYTPAGAIEVLNDVCGYTEDSVFSFDAEEDVSLVSDNLLDATMYYDIDDAKYVNLETTLRQDLALMTEPQYIYGWE